ncbi:MAG: TetR/AcrR family transcriptional regulator [wastewater metagenome]|nr:TetR/AcrR family transcriptional regulator [Candidatus Loosdrechtia aerotolerans]
MGTEKLNTEIRQDQIVQMALSLVASHGLKELSMARIARKVGLVPSAIYRHFKSKDEVLDAVLDYIQRRLLDNVAIVCNETSESIDRLRRLLTYHIKLIRENQGIFRVVFSDELYSGHPERKNKVYEIITKYLGKVSEIIGQGQREGKICIDTDPITISLMFLSIIQQAAILWHVSNEKFDITKHTERVWKIFNESLITK